MLADTSFFIFFFAAAALLSRCSLYAVLLVNIMMTAKIKRRRRTYAFFSHQMFR